MPPSVQAAAVARSAAAGPSLTPALSSDRPQGLEIVGEEVRRTVRSPVAPLKGLRGETRRVWAERIHDPGASYIAPHFSHFDLPAGAYVIVRAKDGSRLWRYEGQGKADLGLKQGFWGIHIPGDEALVEMYSSVPVAEGAVVLDGYARGFPSAEPFALEPESICGTDNSDWAKCYQSSEPTIYSKSRAVARLLIQGTSACTGWLVGDEGHVLTNNHCISSSAAALDTDYEFMAEGATCTTNCASSGACPGTVVATSGTLVRTNVNLDYTLVQLPTNPTATYGFLQMRAAGATVNERMYIPGHPAVWGKRIAVTSTAANDQSGFCEVFSTTEPRCGGTGNDVGYFCDTQGGSSGSPVLAYADHAVIALHHCGGCANTGVPIEGVIDDLGADLPSNSLSGGPPGPVTVTFRSRAAQDGRIEESSETSNVGGTVNSTGVLRIGDVGNDAQLKTILSFKTGAIPDGATILSATLRIRRSGGNGTNPFTTHGTCQADISSTGFSGSNELEASDFQAAATATAVVTLSDAPNVGDWSEGTLSAAGLAAINKTGRTQFRIYFTLDDNDDLGADYLAYTQGDDPDTASVPQLVVTYQ